MRKLFALVGMVIFLASCGNTVTEQFEKVDLSGNINGTVSGVDTAGKIVYVNLYKQGTIYFASSSTIKKTTSILGATFLGSYKIKDIDQDLYAFMTFIDMDSSATLTDGDYYYFSSSGDSSTAGDLNMDDDCKVNIVSSNWKKYTP